MKEGLGEEVERREGRGAPQIHGFDICVLLDWLLTAPFVIPPSLHPLHTTSKPAWPSTFSSFASAEPLPLPTLQPRLLPLASCESEEAQSVQGWITDVL